MAKLLNDKIRLFMAISAGVFLFVLFFQPFPLTRLNLENTLLFVAGFGGIMFVLMFLLFIPVTWFFERDFSPEAGSPFIRVLLEFLFIASSTVALTFYLRYVGSVQITFFTVFKTILISLFPPVIKRLYEGFRRLKLENNILLSQKKVVQEQVDKYKEEMLERTVQFVSESKSEILTLRVAEIMLIRSADNYVEVVYKGDDNFKRSLIRNTLKNIELQLKDYSYFIRCHRTCILNRYYVERLSRSYNSYWITIKGYDEKIPVSRQYIVAVKESLHSSQGQMTLVPDE